jgi:inner membrane protein
MDPVTHTLIGVGLGNGLFRKRLGPAAVPILALAANLPDVDTVVHLTGDSTALLIRRTFGHSIVMFPIWSLLFALVLRRIFPRVRLPTLFGLGLLGCGVHVFFDLINSFGVMVLWPFSSWRPELAIAFIIDLILTGLLAAPLLLALSARLRPLLARFSRASLVAVTAYLALCGAARWTTGRLLAEEVRARGARPEFLYVFPEPLGPHRWRGVVREDDVYEVFLLHALTGEIELKDRLISQVGDPNVARVRETSLSRRIEDFFKAPVWRVDSVGAAGDGGEEDAEVSVLDLRFRSAVLDRDPVFVFRFRLHADGRVERAGLGAPRRSGDLLREDLLAASRAPGSQSLPDLGMAGGDDGGGEEGGVRGSRLADGERPHRNTFRHLHDRQERVETVERCRGDRHAEHRQEGLGGNHTGQVSRPSRSRDDHLEPALLRLLGVLERDVRRPVRGQDAGLERNLQLGQQVASRREDLQIGSASHDDADPRSRGLLCRHNGILQRGGVIVKTGDP